VTTETEENGRETFVVDTRKVDPYALYRTLGDSHVVAHNAAFDAAYLARARCVPRKVSCTRVLSQLLHAGADNVKHDLESVAKRYLPKEVAAEVKADHVDHSVWSTSTLPKEAIEYAAKDSMHLLDIYANLVRLLEKAGMAEVAELEERFTSVVAEASAAGMPVAGDRWGAVVEEAIEKKRDLAAQLDGILGDDVEVPEKFADANKGRDDVCKVNWSSTEQKIWAVESLRLTVPTKWDRRRGEHVKTLDKNHLHRLDHPIADALLEYQAIANFPATFRRAIEERFDGARVYPDWKQIQARTGRMSCASPPMHNMPKKSKLREAIVAPDGRKIVAIDFSQIEPRVLAAISKDRALLKAYGDGEDVYSFVASKVTGVPVEEVTKDLRGVFKTIVLGLIYGMGEHGLALRVHRDISPKIPEEQIVAYRDGFFAAFPEATRWREDLETEFDKGSRETRTILGRRRLRVENPRQRWNAPIQGTATDAFKAAAVALHERKAEVGGFDIVALIHDEVVLLVPEDRAEEIEAWACGVMEKSASDVVNRKLPKKMRIPIAVDGGHGRTLQEAKDVAA
jgi:DNA polymerase-1